MALYNDGRTTERGKARRKRQMIPTKDGGSTAKTPTSGARVR
jgi:hypothetical protein